MSKKFVGSITYACKLIVQNKLYFITINWQSIVYPLGYFLIIDYMVMSFTLLIASHPVCCYDHSTRIDIDYAHPMPLYLSCFHSCYLSSISLWELTFCLTFHWSCHYSILNLLILHLKLPNYVPLVLRGNCPSWAITPHSLSHVEWIISHAYNQLPFSRYVWFLNTPCSSFPL